MIRAFDLFGIIKVLMDFLNKNGSLADILKGIYDLFFSGKITTPKLEEMLKELKLKMEAEANKSPEWPFPPLI